jgi:hypothetical protein
MRSLRNVWQRSLNLYRAIYRLTECPLAAYARPTTVQRGRSPILQVVASIEPSSSSPYFGKNLELFVDSASFRSRYG